MKEAIKGYHMFLPRAWVKWCIYILYPLLVIGGMYALNQYATYFSFICIGLACGMIIMVEYMLDTYVFLGIAARNTNRLEYLKTSAKGLPLLKKALYMDAVRRFLSTGVIMAGVSFVLQLDLAFILKQCIFCIAIVYLIAGLGFMITRFSTNVWLNLVILYILMTVVSIVGIYALSWNIQIWWLLLLGIADVGIVVLGNKLILKRAEESFYDKEF